MKTRLTQLLAALLCAAFTITLHAQTTAFTYQGRLTENGLAALGLYDLQFTLYDADTGGSVIAGPITNAAVAVTNGLFTSTLDFGPGVFDGSDRWLEIGVATNGSGVFNNLSPRQQITSTPYAIQAANAATATVAASANAVAAASITGTVALAQLPTTVLVTNGASGVNISGTFSGNGTGVTNVNLLYANTQGAITFSTNYGNFVLASSPGAGSYPYAVTAADVNGDGKPDLISANAIDIILTVLTNDGSGSFVLASAPNVGDASVSVTAVDVNGDGKLDLISASYYHAALTVLTNDGSGGFVVSSSPPVGITPVSVTSADVNGDGKPDLISANTGNNTLTVLTNDGSGGFVLSSSLPVVGHPQSVTSADVNGDGKPDLISANSGNSTLTILTNDGSGGFVLSSSPGVGSGPRSVTSADVNGDGKPDLISANSGNSTLTILTNDGSGGFVLSSSPGVGSGPRSVTSADVNGDGKPDLISANFSADALTVLTNDGSGGFVVSSSPSVGRYSSPESVTSADVNGDGHPDLITANYNADTLTVLFNVPSAAFTGDGSGLSNLNATNLTGTVALAQLPAAVVTNNETGVTLGGTFSGDGGGLTNLNAGNISSGTVALAQLPTTVLVTNGASGVNLSGAFSGDGSALTNVPGDDLGNHTATENLKLNGHWLSGDGGDEGIFVKSDGTVGIGTSTPGSRLEINSSIPNLLKLYSNPSISTLFYSPIAMLDVSAGANLIGPALTGVMVDLSGTSVSTNYPAIFLGGNVGIGTATPQETLDVKGEIRFTSDQDRYPVATDLKTVMVAGIVTAAGDPSGASSSALFTSTNQSTGTYVLTWNAGFTADPILTATAHGSNYAALGTVNKTTATIYIRDSTGALVNGTFNFIAIGKR